MQEKKNQNNLFQYSEKEALLQKPCYPYQQQGSTNLYSGVVKSVSEQFTGEIDILEIYHNTQKRHLNLNNLLREAFVNPKIIYEK